VIYGAGNLWCFPELVIWEVLHYVVIRIECSSSRQK